MLMWQVKCMPDAARPGVGIMMMLLRRCESLRYFTLCEWDVTLVCRSSKLAVTS